MLSNPELHWPDKDQRARENGLVYIEDLVLSGVMVALKRSSKSALDQGGLNQYLGVIDPGYQANLHTALVEDIAKLDKRRLIRGSKISWMPLANIEFSKNRERQIEVYVGEWDMRGIETTFVSGREFDRENLTGFLPFDPMGYDHKNDYRGLAQHVVDSYRVSASAASS